MPSNAVIETQVQVVAAHDAALAPYLDGATYNEDRIVEETRFWIGQHVTSGLEVGKRLILLKSRVEHGRFISMVEQRFSMSPSLAANLMRFARTIVEAHQIAGNSVTLKKLESMDREKTILLGEVIADSAEEIQELGTIRGRTLDEYDAMPRAELKKLVRAQQDQIETGKGQLQEQKDKTLKAMEKVEALTSATPGAVASATTRLLTSLKDAFADFERTAISNSELPPHVLLDIVSVRSQARAFSEMIHDLTEERFPAVLDADIPADDGPVYVDTVAAPKAKPAKQATVVDAVGESK